MAVIAMTRETARSARMSLQGLPSGSDLMSYTTSLSNTVLSKVRACRKARRVDSLKVKLR